MKMYRAVIGIVGVCVFAVVACSGGHNNDNVQTVVAYSAHYLVSDGAVAADHVDANLKNPWGIAFNPAGPAWVADNATSVSTIYDGNGVLQVPIVSIPNGSNGSANPTGIVYNGTSDFVVSNGTLSGASVFLFDGEGGTITGWSPSVSSSQAFLAYDDGTGAAVYKGLALASSGGANFLYATDFHGAKIDVFDKNFAKVTTHGGFADSMIPTGFAPFGIQNIQGNLYVTFAKQDSGLHDNLDGPGLGYVDLFDADGNLLKRVIAAGALNAPWGIALAPANFGPFSGDLLIGNFGDGVINSYDPATGQFLGRLQQTDGQPIIVDRLWAITFGVGSAANSLFFTGGSNDEADGAYGRIETKTITTSGGSTMCTGYGC